MGIKDWLTGDRKKAAFREELKQSVSDGKLTAQKVAHLEELRKNLDVSGAADDKTTYRREVFNTAVEAVKAGGQLSSAEESELARIQKYLALRNDQVEKTQIDLARLRIINAIQKGNLPVVSPENTALRGLVLEPEEVPHYCVTAVLSETVKFSGPPGTRFESGSVWRAGMAGAFGLPPEDGKLVIGEGQLFVTSRRFLFRGGGRTQTFPFKQPDAIYLYRDGLRLKTRRGHTVYRFKSGSVPDVVGALLSNLMA
ncbi:MAG: hypothetical protein EXR27_15125 [Betaproteobacteria bacterium]|nr:hypothetical protein [Betaproteobacteria bacterium]